MAKKGIGKILSKYSVLIVVFLMVGSAIGMFIGDNVSNTKVEKYNRFEFMTIDNKWITEVDGEEYAFYFFPTELEDYCKKTSMFKEKPMGVLVFNPDIKSEAISLIRFRIDNMEDFYLGTGITKNSNLLEFPILTCDNATTDIPFVVFEKGNNSFVQQANCIKIHSDDEKERLMYGESIMYNILGIC